MKKNGKLERTFQIIGALLIMSVFLAVSSFVGYVIINNIFKISNQNTNLLNTILTVVIGFAIVYIILFPIIRRHGMKEIKKQNNVLDNMLQAMDKISQGDFDVFIPEETNDHNRNFNEFAESINKVAKELGSMETLRQDFISNVSHEINSPLTSIKGFTVLLKNPNLSEEERNHYIDIIEAESTRLSKLSENFLKLASLEDDENVLNSTEFRLDEQIKNVVLMLEPQWKAKEQEIKLDLEVLTINADKDLLYEVWINIIGNSIKFTDNKGIIEISLKKENKEIICEISDNGIGISEKDKMHIFERFYKADKSRTRSSGGNGLGLSLVKKIIELHGGKITVESEVGKGTTFSVVLNF
ncbi:MAG: HAMP domain-containing histidine kinase [Oscillospiraceae bacterium]|nr:HAMP domain-containing histidine kinase [Oscillospiraceae bacterium]